MSKIKLNTNLSNFLKQNKIRICSIALSGVMIASLTACSPNNNKDNSKTNALVSASSEKERQDFLKQNIEKNIENISVEKNENMESYIITEESYIEIPYYETNDSGNLYVTHIEKQSLGTTKYSISFNQAESLEIIELLESKLSINPKTK